MTNMLSTIRNALAIFAVAGIAIFMLAACLGGGGGSGDSSPTPTPTRMTVTPAPTPTPTPTPTRYGAYAYGIPSGERRGYVWAFRSSDNSAAEALTAAQNRCAQLLGSPCETSRSFTNSCAAIAVSECPVGSCRTPAIGAVSGSSSRREAETAAITLCERAASSRVAGTCRVDTGDDGEPGSYCAGVDDGGDDGGDGDGDGGDDGDDGDGDGGDDGDDGDGDNRAPRTRGSIPDQTLRVGGTVTIDLSRYFTDPDGDRLTYSFRLSEGQENQVRASISGDSLRIQGVTPPGPNVRVVASDPSGSQVYQDFRARVSAGYAALAIATSHRGTGYAWAFDYGDSAAATERAAVNRCEGLSGSGGSCRLVGRAYTNSCLAIAVSECRSGTCTWGSSGGRTRSEAETAAIAACERSASGTSLARTCRISTGTYQGQRLPGVVCLGVE